SYLDMSGQLSVAGRKPGLAAKPGTALHGWGIALDLGGGVASKSGAWDWPVEHGDEYGWENPGWAKSSMDEPWHWEYTPARKSIKDKRARSTGALPAARQKRDQTRRARP